eukprot:469521-Pyramimonas_sp.AAC.1
MRRRGRRILLPQGNRRLNVEIVNATHNWDEFFGDLGFTISGITTTKNQKLSNHSWRLIRREDISDYQTGPEDWKIMCPCSEWENWAPEPSDAILL